MTERRRTILKAAELLGLSADEAALLSRHAIVRDVRAGDQLCALRSPAREITFLVSAEADAHLADGSVHPIPCGGVLGELSSLGVRLAQTADVFATKPGLVLVLSADRYQRLKDRLPGLSQRIETARQDRSHYLAQASYERALQRHREMAPLARELGLQAH